MYISFTKPLNSLNSLAIKTFLSRMFDINMGENLLQYKCKISYGIIITSHKCKVLI